MSEVKLQKKYLSDLDYNSSKKLFSILIAISLIAGFIISSIIILSSNSYGTETLITGTVLIGFFSFLLLIASLPDTKLKKYEFSFILEDKSSSLDIDKVDDSILINIKEDIDSLSILDSNGSLLVNEDIKGQESIKFGQRHIDDISENENIKFKLLRDNDVVEEIRVKIEEELVSEEHFSSNLNEYQDVDYE
jgi:hypothetical protein